jgi:hypothetical protein
LGAEAVERGQRALRRDSENRTVARCSAIFGRPVKISIAGLDDAGDGLFAVRARGQRSEVVDRRQHGGECLGGQHGGRRHIQRKKNGAED